MKIELCEVTRCFKSLKMEFFIRSVRKTISYEYLRMVLDATHCLKIKLNVK